MVSVDIFAKVSRTLGWHHRSSMEACCVVFCCFLYVRVLGHKRHLWGSINYLRETQERLYEFENVIKGPNIGASSKWVKFKFWMNYFFKNLNKQIVMWSFVRNHSILKLLSFPTVPKLNQILTEAHDGRPHLKLRSPLWLQVFRKEALERHRLPWFIHTAVLTSHWQGR